MGCIKSKRDYTVKNTIHLQDSHNNDKHAGENIALVEATEEDSKDFPPANPVLLEYAERLSEEIVTKAVKQWAEVDRKYSDIPYIESDFP
ncbi:unnamed protein product [Staurois parvus]|uniref:Small membrane A-kinase anchor protein n=1 Tax=Staurois parvus TaxID=386267 RepID=A0ABN9HPJ5_9NEOB|nr:unnamed protein product [Staurois parvus]